MGTVVGDGLTPIFRMERGKLETASLVLEREWEGTNKEKEMRRFF